MKRIIFTCAVMLVFVSATAMAEGPKNSGGLCSAIQGVLVVVEGVPVESQFTIDGEVESVLQPPPTQESLIPHGRMDRGSEYALIISPLDFSSFFFYEDFTSVHSQNVLTTDPVMFGEVNASGEIVGASGRWSNATGHMTMHGTFNFAVNSLNLRFNGNICGI